MLERADGDDHGGGVLAALRARAGPTPPVTVTRTRPSGEVVGREHLGHGGPQLVVVVGDPQVEAVGRAAQPVEVAAGGEGPAVDGLERLEHAVADGEPVVEDRDGRVGGVHQATRSSQTCSVIARRS